MQNNMILIVEDNRNILSANRELLELSGYRVITASSLAEGRKKVREEHPDLIILDIMLPDGNGLELCRELRENSDVRILFLSALNTKDDVIRGLREGGDDYLGKPYLTEELLLRVAALLRRNASAAGQKPERTGPLFWYPASRQVFVKGKDLLLKPMDYAVLELLCQNRDRFLTSEEIYKKVWNAKPGEDIHPVQNHISELRNKLESYGISISSERDRGYRIRWKEPQRKK
jgi:DNA-binding response OmpR family regulator